MASLPSDRLVVVGTGLDPTAYAKGRLRPGAPRPRGARSRHPGSRPGRRGRGRLRRSSSRSRAPAPRAARALDDRPSTCRPASPAMSAHVSRSAGSAGAMLAHSSTADHGTHSRDPASGTTHARGRRCTATVRDSPALGRLRGIQRALPCALANWPSPRRPIATWTDTPVGALRHRSAWNRATCTRDPVSRWPRPSTRHGEWGPARRASSAWSPARGSVAATSSATGSRSGSAPPTARPSSSPAGPGGISWRAWGRPGMRPAARGRPVGGPCRPIWPPSPPARRPAAAGCPAPTPGPSCAGRPRGASPGASPPRRSSPPCARATAPMRPVCPACAPCAAGSPRGGGGTGPPRPVGPTHRGEPPGRPRPPYPTVPGSASDPSGGSLGGGRMPSSQLRPRLRA